MAAYTEMVDGHPVSFNNSFGEPWIGGERFHSIPLQAQAECIKWCKTYLKPTKCANNRHTSYGLKHMLQRDTGIYITNDQFKDLMLTLGYKPVDSSQFNWTFCISESRLSKRSRNGGW